MAPGRYETMLALVFIAVQALGSTCQERYIDWKSPHSICHEWAESRASILRTFQEDGRTVVVPNPSVLDLDRLPPSLDRLTRTRNVDDRGLRVITSRVSGLADLLAATEPAQAARLRAVQVRIADETSETCGSKTEFNAHYSSSTNAIEVCPLTTHVPIASLVPLLAHELGHVVAQGEAAADQKGFALLGRYLAKHRAAGDLTAYFYASVNCSRGEHQTKDSDYLPSETRMAAFLKSSVVRESVRCE